MSESELLPAPRPACDHPQLLSLIHIETLTRRIECMRCHKVIEITSASLHEMTTRDYAGILALNFGLTWAERIAKSPYFVP